MDIKSKTLVFLITLCLVDMVIPLPILGVILVYVVLGKPAWFREIVKAIYASG
jgi:hypothetical protein